ncbi:MAG: carbohydrate ABC transporter permease [Acetanaerobacterium sp.]
MDALRGGIYILPRKFTLDNYNAVLHKDTLLQAAFITVSRTVVATVVQLFLTAMLAYVLSRREFMFKKSITLLYVLTMYLNAGMIPIYILIKDLHLINNFWVYILPGLVSAFNMIVIRTFIYGIPESLSESAQIDGAGHLTIFVRIILPLCKPVLAVVALFIAVFQWNSWFDTMLYCGFEDQLTTLQYELMKLLSSVTSQNMSAEAMKHTTNLVTPASIRTATTILTALPIVCLYPFLQRYFITGMTLGGVKE